MTTYQKALTVPGNPPAEVSLEIIGLKAGLTTCASLIIYFMIMRVLNFMDSGIAWGLNFIILLSGIIYAYRVYRSKTKLNVDYIPGLILGGITTAASVIPFVLFVYIYFSQVNPQQLLLLQDNILFMGEQITPMRAAVATMVEGLSSGLIITFMMMQYFKSGFRRRKKEIRAQG